MGAQSLWSRSVGRAQPAITQYVPGDVRFLRLLNGLSRLLHTIIAMIGSGGWSWNTLFRQRIVYTYHNSNNNILPSVSDMSSITRDRGRTCKTTIVVILLARFPFVAWEDSGKRLLEWTNENIISVSVNFHCRTVHARCRNFYCSTITVINEFRLVELFDFCEIGIISTILLRSVAHV